MALHLVPGLLRRPVWKLVRLTRGNADSDPATGFSMTSSISDAGAVTLRLCGEIDLTCQERLRNRLIAIIDIDQADGLLVDLDGVTFLDCSGIGALIAGRNTAVAAGCRDEVRNPHGMVSTILWACGVDVALGTDPAPPDAESFAV